MSKPSTVEYFEVSYTDLTGDRRAQTALQEVDAKADASRFAEEGMSDIDIARVTTTSAPVPFKTPKPASTPGD